MSTQAPKFRRGQRVRGIFSGVKREIWEEPSPFKLLPGDQPYYASRIIGEERLPIDIRPQREFEASHEAIDDDQPGKVEKLDTIIDSLETSRGARASGEEFKNAIQSVTNTNQVQVLEKLDRIIDLLESHDA